MFLKFLLMISLSANATEPAKFTILEYKAPAPFEGVLFDSNAMSKILADYDLATYSCDTKTKYQLDIQAEEYDYKLKDLAIEHKALTDEYDLFIIQKDKEIDLLASALKNIAPVQVAVLCWGIAVGTAASYGVYKTLNER